MKLICIAVKGEPSGEIQIPGCEVIANTWASVEGMDFAVPENRASMNPLLEELLIGLS